MIDDLRSGLLQEQAVVDLYWIPLGAGERVVRLSGKVFEAVSALVQRRAPCDLYHSALTIDVPEGRFAVEMAPVIDGDGERRGVVGEGAVGTRWAGWLRLFRYEVRRWQGGTIPDASSAAATARLDVDLGGARRLLELIAAVPTPVWGRDQLAAGEMWNSNSVISWVLARGGVDTTRLGPPAHGRAPGWDAGLAVERRSGGDRGL